MILYIYSFSIYYNILSVSWHHLFGIHSQPIWEMYQHYPISNLTSKSSCFPSFPVESSTLFEKKVCVCVWIVECRWMHMDRERIRVGDGGGGAWEIQQEKEAWSGWVGRQTQFGVVVESINHLITDVFEWTTVEWCMPVHACVRVCVRVCLCACVHVSCVYIIVC